VAAVAVGAVVPAVVAAAVHEARDAAVRAVASRTKGAGSVCRGNSFPAALT